MTVHMALPDEFCPGMEGLTTASGESSPPPICAARGISRVPQDWHRTPGIARFLSNEKVRAAGLQYSGGPLPRQIAGVIAKVQLIISGELLVSVRRVHRLHTVTSRGYGHSAHLHPPRRRVAGMFRGRPDRGSTWRQTRPDTEAGRSARGVHIHGSCVQ